ncbi:hypothetical protein RCL1_003232 [Eukaryota sp. TZLM3-RCL]
MTINETSFQSELYDLLQEHESTFTEEVVSRSPSVVSNDAETVVSLQSLHTMLTQLVETIDSRFSSVEEKLAELTRRFNSAYPESRSRTRNTPAKREVPERNTKKEVVSESPSPDRHSLPPALPSTAADTDLSSIPRTKLFLLYLPQNWYFISFAEVVFSCFRFYDAPISLEFLQDALRDVPILNKSSAIPKKCCELTPSWMVCVDKVLLSFRHFLKRDGSLYALSSKGRSAFTSIGANLGSPEGSEFYEQQRKTRRLTIPHRVVPSSFEFKTVFDLLVDAKVGKRTSRSLDSDPVQRPTSSGVDSQDFVKKMIMSRFA